MTYFDHALVAPAVQSIIGLFTVRWWTGAALASGYFVGREIAQAEYRWIEMFGYGLRANMPWWGPAEMRVWTKADQIVAFIGPITATCTLAWYASRHRHRAGSAP